MLVDTTAAELNLKQPHEIRLYSRAFDRLARAAVYLSAARSLVVAAMEALPEPEPTELDDLRAGD